MPSACRTSSLYVSTRVTRRAWTLPQDIATCKFACGLVTDLYFLPFSAIYCSQHGTIVLISFQITLQTDRGWISVILHKKINASWKTQK